MHQQKPQSVLAQISQASHQTPAPLLLSWWLPGSAAGTQEGNFCFCSSAARPSPERVRCAGHLPASQAAVPHLPGKLHPHPKLMQSGSQLILWTQREFHGWGMSPHVVVSQPCNLGRGAPLTTPTADPGGYGKKGARSPGQLMCFMHHHGSEWAPCWKTGVGA